VKLVPADYALHIEDLNANLHPGLLLVVPDTVRPANVMTIGWVLFGTLWGNPVCAVLVRPSRYTFDLINRAGVFTVNRMPPGHKKAIARCGVASGRDVDKIAEQGWTVEKGQTVDAPFIAEAALHVECRTVLTGQVTQDLDSKLLAGCYPRGDLHTIYYGLVTGTFRHE
jgi:flavin reductase (DIM6/NTAB) family NADH-FMN oxidoreductase RutF